MKTIYTPGTAFGGLEYRVTGDDATCNLQDRKPGEARFYTRATIARSAFDAALEKKGDTPALVARLIEEANRQ